MTMLKTESYRKGIVYSSAFNVVAKLTAFAQQWLIGYYFGVGSGSDVFFFTYNIILYVSFFFLNFTTSVLIPEGMKIRNNESDEASKQFFNTYIIYYSIIGVLLTALCCFNTEWLMGAVSSFSTDIIAENLSLILWCLPIIFLNLVVSLISEILVSYKYFTIPNVVTFVNYVIGITFIVLFHDTLSLPSIAIGLTMGYFANLLIVVLMLKHELRWKFRTDMNARFRQVSSSGLYSQCGHVVYLFALYVPQNIFSQMPSGVLTAVNFADKILSIPSIFLVGQITNVMAVKINNLVSLKQFKELAQLSERLIIYVTLMLLAAAVAISLLSEWIVSLLFSWGNYDMEAMSVTTQVLSAMIFYLPFGFTYGIIVKYYNAFKKQNLFFVIQTLTQVIIVALYFYFIPRLGITSYPPCRILPYMLATLTSVLMLRSFFRELSLWRMLVPMLLIIAVTLCGMIFIA